MDSRWQKSHKKIYPMQAGFKKITPPMPISLKFFSSLLALSALLLLSGAAQAQTWQVNQPSGEYTETATDLSVKTPGGQLQLKRTWVDSRWHINPVWTDLVFEADP